VARLVSRTNTEHARTFPDSEMVKGLLRDPVYRGARSSLPRALHPSLPETDKLGVRAIIALGGGAGA